MDTKTPFTLGTSPNVMDSVIHNSNVNEETTNKRRMLVSGDEEVPDSGLWIPADLPSMGIAGYPAQVYLRKFGLPDLARLGGARKTGSYSHTVSAIGQTIHKIPVGLLTHGDFDFIMNWHEIHSLPKTPKKLQWKSRYGHTNEITLNETSRTTINIKDANAVETLMREGGYDFSRVGDELWRIHMVDADKFNDPINETEFDLATWRMVDDPTDFPSKLAKVRADVNDLDFYEGLYNWRTVADHGIRTVANLRCEHFNPETAINDITKSLAMLDAAATMGEFDDNMQAQTTSLLSELADLRKLQSENRLSEAKAVEEEVLLPLKVSNFFPYLL